MSNSIQFQGNYVFNLEVIAGCTPMPDYPDLWRADVSLERLRQADVRLGSFIFVFVIKGREPYAYGISAHELLNACESSNVSINSSGTPRYQLYISYATGEVYKSASKSSLITKLYSDKG